MMYAKGRTATHLPVGVLGGRDNQMLFRTFEDCLFLPDFDHVELGRNVFQLFFDFGEEVLLAPAFSASLRQSSRRIRVRDAAKPR